MKVWRVSKLTLLLIIMSILGLFNRNYCNLLPNKSEASAKFTIAVHTGAGSYDRNKTSLADEIDIKKGVLDGLKAAFEQFKAGRSNLDAVQAALQEFETNPLFNAGVGSKIDESFHITMDSSIMNGKDLSCGSIAGVKHVKHPIQAARLVMERTKHVMLIGSDADNFAKKSGLETEPNFYFFTKKRVEEWFEQKKRLEEFPKGTTGVVALDSNGNLAAGTSTGGTTYKMAGRVGDSPIIGAGNYANNKSLGVSCTGTGEIFMKNLVGFDLHARMVYKGLTLKQSADEVINSLPQDAGGFVAVDNQGNVEMPFNSSGMARGYVKEDGIAHVYIFREGEDITPTKYDISSQNHEPIY